MVSRFLCQQYAMPPGCNKDGAETKTGRLKRSGTLVIQLTFLRVRSVGLLVEQISSKMMACVVTTNMHKIVSLKGK